MESSASNYVGSRVSSRWRQLPNVLSVVRILLIAPIAWALLRRELLAAAAIFAVAAASDAADGFLARRYGWQSELGGILDPMADKLLLISVFITLSVMQLVPLWLAVTAVVRDLIIVLGATAYHGFVGPLPSHPSPVSKLNTLCQALLILAVLGHAQVSIPAAWAVQALGALTFASTVISGTDYVLVYGRRALRAASTP